MLLIIYMKLFRFLKNTIVVMKDFKFNYINTLFS